MKAEMPGPIIDKLVPRTRDTALILYKIYLGLAGLEFLFLVLGDMNAFEAVIYTMSTAGTGGFATVGSSLTGYSVYSQWVVTFFMLVFGVNFNIYFMLLLKKGIKSLKSSELITYLGIFAAASLFISVNIHGMYGSVSETIRASAFQVASIMTTTGFVTNDFNLWPQFSKTVLVLLMFTGACAGSTAGGFKISRFIIMLKSLGREFSVLIHPRTVKSIRLEGKKLSEDTVKGVNVYMAAYVCCLFAIMLLLSFDRFDLGTDFVLTMTTFNNVGPAMCLLSSYDSFSSLSFFSKIVLSFSMLLGRLEIFPIVLTCLPSTWRKKH